MTHRPTRMGRLVRFSRLKEEKATHAWLGARGESERAREAHDQALSALGQIAAWKSAGAASGGLNVDHYLAALELEVGAVEQARSREDALRDCEQAVQAAREKVESAKASTKGAERRQARQIRQVMDAVEKKGFEDIRDAWLVRVETSDE